MYAEHDHQTVMIYVIVLLFWGTMAVCWEL